MKEAILPLKINLPPFCGPLNAGVLLLIIVYVGLSVFHADYPLSNDEVFEFYASKELYTSGHAAMVTGERHWHHPYGYCFLSSTTPMANAYVWDSTPG